MEKITKALLLVRGVEAGIEHRLEELLKRFPSMTSGRLGCCRSSDILRMQPRFAIPRRVAGSPQILPRMRCAAVSPRCVSW